MGRLIPAGTGMKYYRNVQVDYDPTMDIREPEEMDEFDIRGGVDQPGEIPLVSSAAAPKVIKKKSGDEGEEDEKKAAKAAKADSSTDDDDDF